MNPVLLTIVVPVFNREHLVERTLDSIKAQVYRPLHLIIVDNDSTDSTLSTVLQWCSQNSSDLFNVTVAVESKSGAASARNAGLNLVNTPWTMFFDSDDVMSPTHVSSIMQYLDKNPDMDIIGWDVVISSTDRHKSVKYFPDCPDVYNCIMDGTMSTQRYMARTNLFKLAGGWNESVGVWDDIELGSRLLQVPGVKIGRLIKNTPSVTVFAHDDSITGPSFSSRSESSERTLKIMGKFLPPELNYVIQLKRVILAANYYKEGNVKGAKGLYRQALGETYSPWNMWLMKMAYHYTRMGGRGAAKILRRFFVNEPDIDSES